MPDQLQDRATLREIVRERYAAAARAAAEAPEQSGCGCGSASEGSCCGSDASSAVFGSALYDDAEAGQAPEAALNASRAVLPATLRSNPTYRKANPSDAPIIILALTSATLTGGGGL